MGNRGLWNLRIDGKWYRHCHRTQRVSYPDHKITLKIIKDLELSRTPLQKDGWVDAPFPSPINPNFNYVYTLDLDKGHLIVTQMNYENEVRAPKHSLIRLNAIHSPSDLSADAILRNSSDPSEHLGRNEEKESNKKGLTMPYGNLSISMGMPSPLNELQYRVFMDFTFQWRYYIDDPLIWDFPSRLFHTLVIALLRLAAWDFEVTFDNPVELPISPTGIPRWKAPESDIFWFHGFLVVQCREVDTAPSVVAATSRAMDFLKQAENEDRTTRVILTSLRHIVLAEISPESTLCSDVIPLLLNTSARQPSPGFRVLAHIFTSSRWKQELAERETWGITLPPELLEMVLIAAQPKDVLTFGQASFTGELWYYSTVPQLGDIKILDFDASIPCCGDRNTAWQGVYCRRCFVWKHVQCLRLNDDPANKPYLCHGCGSNETCWDLDIGAIGDATRRQERRRGCLINCANAQKILQLRLSQPTHLRPELHGRKGLWNSSPKLIDYTIRIGGVFSGHSYGLEDTV